MSDENCKCKTCKSGHAAETITESTSPPLVSLKLLTLLESPKIDCKITNAENVIYVDLVDVIKESCGTGRLQLLDREILVNVCESDNVVHVNLDLEVNNRQLYNIPFIVKLNKHNSKTHIELNEKVLAFL